MGEWVARKQSLDFIGLGVFGLVHAIQITPTPDFGNLFLVAVGKITH
jgi:hypothetical protein